MNRYVAEGIVRDLLEAKMILYVGDNQAGTREAFHQVAAQAGGIEGVTVRRAAGAERISHTGGGIVHFASINSRGVRGLVGDVAYLDGRTGEDQEKVHPISLTFWEVMRA